MATTENNRQGLPKDQALLKVPIKRLMRGNGVDGTPIKKRVMAALNLSCKKIPETSLGSNGACEYQVSKAMNAMEPNPDLSPGLKHTLAQFSLSSQCSLGGPAAFSGHHGQHKLAPPLAQGGVAGGPLLVPPDSSTDLGLCSLEGESISCFSVGGELRLCLPQLLNTILRDFSLQQINSVCDQLYLYCSRCDTTQLHILKVLGVLPPGTPSCGLITLTDAQRLCNTLLHPGEDLSLESHKGYGAGEEKEKDSEESGGFWVEHQCLGKCQGLFVPQLYSSPDAPCIRCSQCRKLFCPERFVMHSHRQPDKRTCHWGFDSAKWACYLQLAHRYLGTADEEKLQQTLEDMKAKYRQEKREPHQGESSPDFVFDSHLIASLKEDPDHDDLMWQSWYQCMPDKLAGNCLAQHPGCVPEKEMGSPRIEMLGGPAKHGDSQSNKRQDVDNSYTKTPIFSGQKMACHTNSDDGSPDCKRSVGVNAEHSQEGMVMELLQMYSAQHEKLQSTLCRQKQLEKELQALHQGEAIDRRDQRTETVQTEHAQRLGEVQQEQRKLKSRLNQLRQQGCRCKELGTEQHQETIYAKQLSELRQRLDRAEEDREELQEELRRERDARERLERTISELKQQMREPAPPASVDSPMSSASSDTFMSLTP
ncbi:SKI-like proto-oncogene b [Myxocyprinus asiaticus]|uniref:SKI-like proto-oncogene b n=1 Tax=Myxocyprinus asiaticus TaxID=70543 RepID=UPI002222F384|nr:SKI-like proto-oncogene b [Myxocyprinus asiaticus]